jgi:hypothetical protein
LSQGYKLAVDREQDLILSAISLDISCNQKVFSLLKSGVDWSKLIVLAHRHGIFPYLYHSLNEFAENQIIPKIRQELDNLMEANVHKNIRQIWKLTQCIDIFRANHIECIVLKGPAIAFTAYGDLSLRPYSDLDILIQEKDFSFAYSLLEQAQFYPAYKLYQKQLNFQLRTGDQFSFNQKGDILEMHWRIAPRENIRPSYTQQMWREVQTIKVLDKNIDVLSQENSILFICLHGAKHGWNQLKWILDLALLSRSVPEDFWMNLIKKSIDMGVGRQLNLGLLLTQDMIGITFPKTVNEVIYKDHQAIRLARIVETNLFRRPSKSTILDNYFFYFNTRECWRDRLHYLVSLIFVPKQPDWQTISLSGWIYPLYYALRPVRLFYLLLRELFPLNRSR